MREDLKPIAWGAVNSLEGADKVIIALARKNVTFNSPHVKHIVEDVLHLPTLKILSKVNSSKISRS